MLVKPDERPFAECMETRTVYIENRNAGIVLLLSIVTCGLYLIYWYYKVYQEMTWLTGATPTGNSFLMDMVISIITLGIWGIYVDYTISQKLHQVQKSRGIQAEETGTLVIILDVAAYLTGFITNFVSSAIQQDILNQFSGQPITVSLETFVGTGVAGSAPAQYRPPSQPPSSGNVSTTDTQSEDPSTKPPSSGYPTNQDQNPYG